MWLRATCRLDFSISLPTPFILMLRPRSGYQQWITKEEYRTWPVIPVSEFTDIYGNLCQRLIAPAGNFAIQTTAEVNTADQMDQAPGSPFVEVQDLPDSVLIYLLPSRFCESDRFGEMATEITVNELPGYNQVAAITSYLRDRIQYIPGSSDMAISAVEVNMRQSGVCRDLAHLGIALCRSLSIPARLAVGYLHGLKPMDMHAWFEAYVNGQWYTFDPTQSELRGGYIVIGYGRDAADVAVNNQFGPPVFPVGYKISVEKIEPPDEQKQTNIQVDF